MDDILKVLFSGALVLCCFMLFLMHMQEKLKAPIPLVVYCETDIPEDLYAPPAALLP